MKKMYSWSRRTSWSVRGIRMKLQHVPTQTCKACIRCSMRVFESEWTRYCFIFVILSTVCCLLFGWVLFRDPCFEWEIRTSLCNDYQNGLIAGSLCYDLCIEDIVSLSSCIEQDGQHSVFKWEDQVIKARLPEKEGSQSNTDSIWEGMTQTDFSNVIKNLFTRVLGNNDHSSLIKRALSYADFNRDGQLTYGEVNSLWQLLQIQEFQTLFIFQHNSVFPKINGTCGSLYAYEAAYHQMLYSKNTSSYIDRAFPNRYRWHLPEFPKRMHIALGLLEYVYTTMETENTKFYMCNFSPKNFGYTEYFEMKVSNVQGIISEQFLNKTLQSKTCETDADCLYGDVCKSRCNKNIHRCSGVGVNYIPDLVKICHILQDYLVYNLPVKLKYTLSHVVADCIRMAKKLHSKSASMILVDQNLALDRLNQVLWNELKYAENKWLTKPTKKPSVML
ncbi:divergent protein kinase domain 1A-like isoform X2 [Mercenaria mercenaria]|uniref:divergent protein kinase domain 1A-like isoform X2 n=1 Tax=Mercenaria mercenaria TaxID=6596 RepID=UPI001E1D45FE|nr:divergent protein kinase domain 1A-like isoform X2 [Mercenaria mercenaria]